MSTDHSQKSPESKTHPAIRFENVPVVEGPLFRMNQKRLKIVRGVVRDTARDFETRDLDLLIGEALFQEKLRLKSIGKFRPSQIFTFPRNKADRKLWSSVYSGIRIRSTEADRREMLEKILSHYSEEIAGNFDVRVYKFATHAIPWMFSWFLNAANVKRVLPWGMTESLEDRLRLLGEIPHLQQLSKKGTILLVPTHQSNIDSVLIGYLIYLMSLPPFCYGAGLNLFTNPVLSFLMGNLGAYTVDRMKQNEIYKICLKNYSTRVLREGVHSIFFPGGGRSRDGAIETNLKLGLLGTGLEAQIENLRRGRANPKVFVVPMVTSFHFVLEASSLIEQYLTNIGKSRFLGADVEESPDIVRFGHFFYKFFAAKTSVTVRIGKPLDIFGNLVDEDGNSIGPNGTTINTDRWLFTRGELKKDKDRDREYVRELGKSLVSRYYQENTVLTSHLVAFAYFLQLRKKYSELDLYRFLRLSLAQRSIPFDDFVRECEDLYRRLQKMEQDEELHLSEDFKNRSSLEWIKDGIEQIGIFHEAAVIRAEDGMVWTEDMNLLYYYRNRLSGYGLSLLGERGRAKRLRGKTDEQGFLA